MIRARRGWVLLDRDGTINVERHYLSDPADVALIPGAAQAIRSFNSADFGVVVVTNQSGVGRGYFTPQTLSAINARLTALLQAEGALLDAIYVCPHLPADNCACRKPAPGMAEQAANDFGFDPRTAFVIGDKPADVNLGRAIGATTFLVRTGYGHQHEADSLADFVVDDLMAAATQITRLAVQF